MKKTADVTLEILKGIRGDLGKANGRIDQTNARIDQTNTHLDQTNAHLEALRTEMSAGFDALGRRIVESEIRTATALTDLAGTVREMTFVLKSQADLRPRVERCEDDIAAIKRQLGPRGVK